MPVTQDQANRYANLLKEFADKERLTRVLLFGSIVRGGTGRDLDIIVEVTEEVFVSFAQDCIGAFDGFHPIEKVLMPGASMYWDYHSPESARLEYALGAIGIATENMRQQLREEVSDGRVDILCLPVGWSEPGYASGLLEKNFGNLGDDPRILENIRRAAIPI